MGDSIGTKAPFHPGASGINSPGYGKDRGVTEDGLRPWPGYKGKLYDSTTKELLNG
jgi:hypothetical protein